MIPQAPIFPPPLPSGFEAGGIPVAPFVPPEFDPEADVLLPPAVEPQPLAGLPAPPAPVPPDAPMSAVTPAPLLDTLGAQPPPADGPDVAVSQGWDRLGQYGAARTQAEREAASAADELRQHAAAYQAAKTPAEQRKIMAAAEQAKQRIDGAGVTAQAAGLAMERERAAQQAEIESLVSKERTARYQEAATLLDARAAETEARVAGLQAERARAQERRAAREKEYAALLDRGPQDSGATWTAAVGMVGELWSAFAQNREPNLGTWLERGLEQARTKHAGELDAIRAQIGADEQAVEDVAVEVAQRKADDLAFEQSYLAKLDRDLALLAAQYGQTPQGMAAEQARRQVAMQQQARAAESQAAYDKAERERAKAAAEMRKTNAEAALLERKLSGGGQKTGAEFGRRTDISETALVDPVSGVVIGESRFKGRSEVRNAQATIDGFSTSIQDLEDYLNQLEKVGKTYRGYGAKAVRDDERAILEGMYSNLFMKTTMALTGAAVSKMQEKLITDIIPEPKSYLDVSSFEPATVMRNYRDRMAGEYERFLTSHLEEGGTRIRGPRGEVLPTSPTYSYRANQGQEPVKGTVGKVVEELVPRDEETRGVLDVFLGTPSQPREPSTFDVAKVRRGDPALSEPEAQAHAQVRVDMRDPWRQRVVQHWEQAARADEKERSKILEALESTRDALKATGATERAKYLDQALKFARDGRGPADYYRSLAPDAAK